MSFQAMNWAVSVKTGSPTLKAVLMAVANYADVEDGTCFPSQQKLADELEVSSRTVMRALERLEEMGLIHRQRRHNPVDGSRSSDRITLSMGVPERTPADHLSDNLSPRSKVTLTTGLSDKACHRNRYEQVDITGKDARARKSKVPQDFQPNEASVKRALEKGLEVADIPHAVTEFIDYWTGRGDPMADWQATFRNSLDIYLSKKRRNQHGTALTANRPQRAEPPSSTLAERFDILRGIIEQG